MPKGESGDMPSRFSFQLHEFLQSQSDRRMCIITILVTSSEFMLPVVADERAVCGAARELELRKEQGWVMVAFSSCLLHALKRYI